MTIFTLYVSIFPTKHFWHLGPEVCSLLSVAKGQIFRMGYLRPQKGFSVCTNHKLWFSNMLPNCNFGLQPKSITKFGRGEWRASLSNTRMLKTIFKSRQWTHRPKFYLKLFFLCISFSFKENGMLSKNKSKTFPLFKSNYRHGDLLASAGNHTGDVCDLYKVTICDHLVNIH